MASEDAQRWDAKYSSRPDASPFPSPVLVSLAHWLPKSGRAVDLAGGLGGNALWLAERGLDVTLVDISEVAVARASASAERLGARLCTQHLDLEREAPVGDWDVVTSCNYVDRELWGRLCLTAGATIVWIHPTMPNLERNPKPSARFLLQPGEGHRVIAETPGLEVVHRQEDWIDGRHLSVVVGRAPQGVAQ